MRNAAVASRTSARRVATFDSWNERVFGVRQAVNADLMITVAFCLYILVGSLAMGALAARSIREDQAKETAAKRRAAGGEPAG